MIPLPMLLLLAIVILVLILASPALFLGCAFLFYLYWSSWKEQERVEKWNAVPGSPSALGAALREEAQRHFEDAQRHKDAAAAAYDRRDHAAVKRLNNMAKRSKRLAEKANSRAKKRILKAHSERNPSHQHLDLHGLIVQEALEALENRMALLRSRNRGVVLFTLGLTSKAFLLDYGYPTGCNLALFDRMKQSLVEDERPILQEGMKQGRVEVLSVVTGRGMHSEGGQARVRPSVIQYLDDYGHRWRQGENDGIVEVLC